MKKFIIVLVAFAFVLTTGFVAIQQNGKTEASEHPRIEKAIHELQDAIEYMEKAPHDFGGNKAAAIRDSKAAIGSLKLALAYRAKQDNKGKK
jgi:hypothetical protein